MIIENREYLAFEIKKALKARGLNVVRLGDLMNVSQQSISRTVNRSDISVNQLLKICEALDADLDISIKLRD